MAKCWTCGTTVSGNTYVCSSCEDVVRELKNIDVSISVGIEGLARIQEAGFNQLSGQLSEIATILEWGFGELSWQLQKQTDILRSIDNTLKTPSETKANEWRKMGEELRRRGVLNDSEEFFLKALESNRLDYRIYIGLAHTYLQGNQFDKAKAILEKSLPHAPKQEIDYKSYSYRLIGHIYACKEDYNQAVSTLRSSIELSPNYEDGHYDYAQYSAQKKETENCLPSLQKAILVKPIYWYLAKKERNFDPIRTKVEKILSKLYSEASINAKDAIDKSESLLKEAHKALAVARHALSVAREKTILASSTLCENSEEKLKLAKDKVASGDYMAFVEAIPIAEKSYHLSKEALNKAHIEKRHYEKKRSEKVKNAWSRVPGAFFGWPLVFGILGWFVFGTGGCMSRVFRRYYENAFEVFKAYGNEGVYGFYIGIMGGILFGIYNILKELGSRSD